MAISLAYGLLFGTFFILVVLPASYLVTNKARVMWMKLYHGVEVSPEGVEPAILELQANSSVNPIEVGTSS